MSPVYSSAHSLEGMRRAYGAVPRAVPFFSVGMYDQTIPFLLRRTVTLVDYRGELALGLDAEPDKWMPTLDAFRRRWKRLDDAYAVMHPETYKLLQHEGLPMIVLAEDPRRVIVRRPNWALGYRDTRLPWCDSRSC